MRLAASKRLSDAEKVRLLEGKVASLEQQLDWFKREVFGCKLEKRRIEDCQDQPLLSGFEPGEATPHAVEQETLTYTRRKQRLRDRQWSALWRLGAEADHSLQGPRVRG
ncbi:MAG: hypothetical protein KDK91_13295 [Gammaproteobacteria bacterium]|nr:hypothetical protein [Gammaproteobacteria bacterium]